MIKIIIIIIFIITRKIIITTTKTIITINHYNKDKIYNNNTMNKNNIRLKNIKNNDARIKININFIINNK